MPKKLTILGALMVLVVGALGVFHDNSASATPIQTFLTTNINWDACYGGSAPSGSLTCGAGSSNSAAAADTAMVSYSLIDIPVGSRETLPITFTPSAAGQWQSVTPACGGTNANNDCLGGTNTGDVTARTDLLCSNGPPDILAVNPSPTGAWPSAANWNSFPFIRTAASVANGGTGEPIAPSAQAYVPQIVPFPRTAPNAYMFTSLDTATLDNLYLGGSAPYAITPVPLQLAVYESAYVSGLTLSAALLGGAPGNPPQNDYLCLDSPQDSATTITYLKTPATPGIYPRWTIFTSNVDVVDGSVSRILDLQCVNIGGVSVTDADMDCLETNLLTGATGPDLNIEYLSASTTGTTATDDEAFRNRGAALASSTFKQTFKFTGAASLSGCTVTVTASNGASFTSSSVSMVGDTATVTINGLVMPTNGVITKTITCTFTGTITDNTATINSDAAITEDAGAPANNTCIAPVGQGTACADAGDTNDADGDQDGDKVPDGVESASGTNMNGADTDADVSDDFEELFQSTNANDADTDDDGSKDKLDNGSDEDGASPTVITDSALDDNCPAVANAGTPQTNTDYSNTYHGVAGSGDSTGNTNPDQDALGDACDTDDDNDNMVDVAEDGVTIIAWGGNGTTVCKGPGVGAAPEITINKLNGDSDSDLVLDGIECQQSGRPDVACSDATKCPLLPASRVAPCINSPLDTRGCAQPKLVAGDDGDGDGLYAPGMGGGGQLAIENFYRVQAINVSAILQANDTDYDGVNGLGDKDSDNDWDKTGCVAACPTTVVMQDGVEVKFYGTEPSNRDTDGDGCDDAREMVDVTGDRTVTSGDQGLWASKKIALPEAGKLDADGDGVVVATLINFDFNKDKSLTSADQGIMATIIANSKPCAASIQGGKTILGAMKLAPAN